MKFAVVVLCAAFAVAHAGFTQILPAATLVRTPHLDTAIISSNQAGANFAYSTVEGHAYQAVAPHAYQAVAPVFRAAYPYTVSALPYGFPAVQQYVAAGGLPVISPLAPLPTLQLAGAEEAKPEKTENAPETSTETAENKPAEEGAAKADGDSVTVETA